MQRKIIELDQGWADIQNGITKLKRILEGFPEPPFNWAGYMMLYTTTYTMCTQKAPHEYSRQLYDRYQEAVQEYVTSIELPVLREKHGEFLLMEVVKRWENHKVFVRWLTRFFYYLDRYFIHRFQLAPLKEVGMVGFRDLVYKELKGKVRDAVISLIHKEREGEQIDRALLMNVLDMFVEIGMGTMDRYVEDFENQLILETVSYYSKKASNWITNDSVS